MNTHNQHTIEELTDEQLSDISIYEHPFSNMNLISIKHRVQEKRRRSIRQNFTVKILFAAAAIAIMGFTVYAFSNYYYLSFMQDGKFIMIRAMNDYKNQEPDSEGVVLDDLMFVTDIENYTFSSISQAQEEMNITVVIPSNLSNMVFEKASGKITHWYNDDESRQYNVLWVTFADDEDRSLLITCHQWIESNKITVSNTITFDDSIPFISDTGIEFALRSELDYVSKEVNYHAYAMSRNLGCDYSYSFYGYSEENMKSILNSVESSLF